MKDGMDEHRKTMRETQLKKLSTERLRILRSAETCIFSHKEVAPQEIETAALLQIGRDENAFQGSIAAEKYRDLLRTFNNQPWWKRLLQAWRGL